MRSRASSQSSQRGGALILTLLFIALVTTGFVVWINLIRQRARVGDLEEHQARKRLAAANATIVVRDYLLRRVLAGNYDDNLTCPTNGTSDATRHQGWDGSGQANGGAWAGYPMASSTKPAGLNAFSPSWDFPYAKTLDFTADYRTLTFPDETVTFTADATSIRGFVRSFNPILGGDLLILHRNTVTATTPAVSGDVRVQGRVLHFAPELSISYTARSLRFASPGQYALNITPRDLSGNTLMPSNLAWTPLSAGSVGADNWASGSYEGIASDWRLPDFTGQMNVIDGAASNPSNSLKAKIAAEGPLAPTNSNGTSWDDSRGFDFTGGTGNIATITPFKSATTGTIPSVILSQDNTLAEIIIDGQSTANFAAAQNNAALAVIYTQKAAGTNLQRVRLRNLNNRRLILALKKEARSTWPSPATSPAVDIIVEASTAAPEWHMVLLCENVPVNLTFSSAAPYNATSLRVFGGIQTNAGLTVQSGRQLELNLETDTRGLIRYTPRLAWVETYLTGKL